MRTMQLIETKARLRKLLDFNQGFFLSCNRECCQNSCLLSLHYFKSHILGFMQS